MRVRSVRLINFRSFVDSGPIELGPLNILVGANNTGKSSILRALYLMQAGLNRQHADVRVGTGKARVEIALEEVKDIHKWTSAANCGAGELSVNLESTNRLDGSMQMRMKTPDGGLHSASPISAVDPEHFIVPYLSRRRTSTYQEDVRSQHALQVNPSMEFLAAKLSRLANPSFPTYVEYSENCKAILGFVITSIPSENGQRPGVYLPSRESIPIEQMGDGVPQIAALLADLALSQNKLFLVEEPENDLHPRALKALLDLILKSTDSNQFVVSTHSNVVVRHLGSDAKARLFSVVTQTDRLPAEAVISPVDATPQARMAVLRELGYSLSDFDLWSGWLILEESSAERIIRDYLIPWFAPKLTRVRTLSVGGIDEVEPTLAEFNRLIRFTHLEELYRDATWVRVDGDERGRQIVGQLQARYGSWSRDRFGCFSEAQFERYYPEDFAYRVDEVLGISDRAERRSAKKALLDEVRAWLDEDSERGRKAIERSAAPVISELLAMQEQLSA